MSNKLLIERTTLFDKLAVIDSKNALLELKVIAKDSEPKVGQIYAGFVENYQMTLGAAFVNIGEDSVFLPSKKKLQPGERIFVQIQREAEKNKKARATEDITIAGKFAVLIENGKSIVLPKKNRDSREQKKLAKKLQEESWEYGFLLRSHCELSDYDEIAEELEKLQTLRKNFSLSKIGLVYDSNSMEQMVESFVTKWKIRSIACDDKACYKLLSKKYESEKILVEYIEHSLFERHHLNLMDKIRGSETKDDFSITVNYLEALCVIDVNSPMQDQSIRDRKILSVNQAAFAYIMDYIEKFALGGMILIDFITMSDEYRDRLEAFIFEFFSKNILRDRRIKFYPMNSSCLFQMVIERTQTSIVQQMTATCPMCAGSGIVSSSKALIDEMELELKRHQHHFPEQGVSIIVPNYFSENETNIIEDIASNCHISYNIERSNFLENVKSDEPKIVAKNSEQKTSRSNLQNQIIIVATGE